MIVAILKKSNSKSKELNVFEPLYISIPLILYLYWKIIEEVFTANVR